MELLNIKYIDNLINIGFEKSKIRSIDILKQKLILLLDESTLIIYDLNAGKISKKNFNEFLKMVVINNDYIFILKRSGCLDVIDPNSLEILNTFNISDNPYYFCFFEDFNTFNLEIIYCTEKNELVYYSQGYLFERKKFLYKETLKIDKVIYQNNILIWGSNYNIKVFDLEKKQMILGKNYEGLVKLKPDLNTQKLNFMLFDKHLCVSVNKATLIIYKIEDLKAQETFKIEYNSVKMLGFWMNNLLNKITILNTNTNKFNHQNIMLEIHNLETKTLVFQREYNFINACSELKFSFSHKHSLVYVYDEKEIFHLTINDKMNKIFEDLKINKINIEEILENYSKIMSEKKIWVLNKIIVNLSQLTQKNISNFENSFHAIISKSTNPYLFNTMIDVSLKEKNFELLYPFLHDYLKVIEARQKEKIILYCLTRKNDVLLLEFLKKITISKEEDIDYEKIEENFEKIIQEEINESNRRKIIFCFSNFYIKYPNVDKAVENYIKIKEIDEIYNLIQIYNYPEIINKFDDLITIFTSTKIVDILISLNYKDKTSCLIFYEKIKDLNKAKYLELIEKIVESDKLFLIPQDLGNSIALFLIDSKSTMLKNYIDKSKTLDYNLILEKFKSSLEGLRFEDTNTDVINQVLISIYMKLQTYRKIIDVYIEKMKDPEKAVHFIENLGLLENDKNDLFKYLKNFIENSNWLSSIKKLYFITLFQDNILEEQLMERLEGGKEDMKYILLIIDQIKLKIKILNLSKEICSKNVFRHLNNYKHALTKGLAYNVINYSKCLKCKLAFKKSDKIFIYTTCAHVFHEFCLYRPLIKITQKKSNLEEENNNFIQTSEDLELDFGNSTSKKKEEEESVFIECEICMKSNNN